MSEVDVRGRTPNIFISRADSHDAGGDGGEVSSVLDVGEGMSQVKGVDGAVDGLSLRVMVAQVQRCQLPKRRHASQVT